jgi:hypothetical protein
MSTQCVRLKRCVRSKQQRSSGAAGNTKQHASNTKLLQVLALEYHCCPRAAPYRFDRTGALSRHTSLAAQTSAGASHPFMQAGSFHASRLPRKQVCESRGLHPPVGLCPSANSKFARDHDSYSGFDSIGSTALAASAGLRAPVVSSSLSVGDLPAPSSKHGHRPPFRARPCPNP